MVYHVKLPAEWPAPAGRLLIPTEVGTFVG